MGNLFPGEAVEIRIHYITQLEVELNQQANSNLISSGWRFVLPTTIAPRYNPNSSDNGMFSPFF